MEHHISRLVCLHRSSMRSDMNDPIIALAP
jgi:hypothetical protein